MPRINSKQISDFDSVITAQDVTFAELEAKISLYS